MALSLGGLAWLVIWWVFLAGDYTVAQGLGVTLASLLLVGGLWLLLSLSGWTLSLATRVIYLVVAGLGFGMAYLLWGPWNDMGTGKSLGIVIAIVVVFALVTAPFWIWRLMTWKVTVEANVEVTAEMSVNIEQKDDDQDA